MPTLRPAPTPEVASIINVVLRDVHPASVALAEAHTLAAMGRPDIAAELTQRIADVTTGTPRSELLVACANHALSARRWRLARQAVSLLVLSDTAPSHGVSASLAQRFSEHHDHHTAATLFSLAASSAPDSETASELFVDAALAHRAQRSFEPAVETALKAARLESRFSARAWEIAVECCVALDDLEWAQDILSRWPEALSPVRRIWVSVLVAERRRDHHTAAELLQQLPAHVNTLLSAELLDAEHLDTELLDALLSKSANVLGADAAKRLVLPHTDPPPTARRAIALALLREHRPDEALVVIDRDDSFAGCALRLAALAALGSTHELRAALSDIESRHKPNPAQRATLLLHAAPLCVSLQPEYASAIEACCEANSVEPLIALAQQMCAVCSHPVLLHAAEWVLASHGSQHAGVVMPWIRRSASAADDPTPTLTRIHALLPTHLKPHIDLIALERDAPEHPSMVAQRASELARAFQRHDPELAAKAAALAARCSTSATVGTLH